MELDQFKDVYLVIDKANNSFVQKQFVSQGDYKGRTLTVQITNNGSVGEVPGITLNLNWHNEASGITDLTAFNVLDKANSIFRIEYPQNMMTPGKVYASIQVIQDGKVTNLQQFELIVQKLAGQPVGIPEKAEFSALVAVLADANKFRTDIDKKADKTFVTAQLAQNITQTEFNSWVATLLDGGPSIFMDTLAALKSTYPNGASGVALVGETDPAKIYVWDGSVWKDFGDYQGIALKDNSVTSGKIAPDAVTSREAKFISETKNLFVYDNFIPGYAINVGNGVDVFESHDIGYTPEYIRVQGGESIYKGKAGGMIVYDSNKMKIASFDHNAGPQAYLLPDNAWYVRLNINISDRDNYQLEYGTSETEYVRGEHRLEKEIKVNRDNIKNVNGSVVDNDSITPEKLSDMVVSPNFHNPNVYTQGHLDRNTGLVVVDALNRTSPFIRVKDSKFTQASIPSEPYNLMNIVYCDASKNVISNEQLPGGSPTRTVTVPSGSVFIRYSLANDIYENYRITWGESLSDEPHYQYPSWLALPKERQHGVDVSVAESEIVIDMPAGSGTTRYKLLKKTKPYTDGGTYQNYNGWRIVNCEIVKNGVANSIVTDGAWECAISITGLPDFHGTYHGYEQMKDLYIYADNQKIGIGNYQADSLRLVYTSYLIKQGTVDQKIADVVRIYTFEDGVLRLKQRYQWVDSFTINQGYITMLPILRTGVTHTAIADFDCKEYDVSNPANYQTINAQQPNVENSQVYGDQVGAYVDVKYKDKTVSNRFNVSNSEQYNKLYYSYSPGVTVGNGTKWEVESIFDIKGK